MNTDFDYQLKVEIGESGGFFVCLFVFFFQFC